jgi:hypothetical protein
MLAWHVRLVLLAYSAVVCFVCSPGAGSPAVLVTPASPTAGSSGKTSAAGLQRIVRLLSDMLVVADTGGALPLPPGAIQQPRVHLAYHGRFTLCIFV